MKNVIAIILLLGISLTAYAQNGIKVRALNDGKKVVLTVSEATPDLTVELINEKGELQRIDRVNAADGYQKILNMEKLENGNYDLVVHTMQKEVVFPMVIEEKSIVIDENAKEQYFKPVVAKTADNAFDVSYLNGKITDVSVSITDADGVAVYKEVFDNIIKLQKRFKLEAFKSGEYTVAIKTPARSYYRKVALDD